ncbi:hypothetical protein Nhal_1043 [Nitrosococcus halophilus Nc 4]|uniref:Uncharacterized protein n=1 Tax=Nitrosococcus halophilus (strain Nc4) TaxID=472759 RepID=D5BZ03_NITHN|nr:hypothetical protein [Nitrosococcus halophilus]ADE14216.1 hypothetical protein Nhal_1043 [Nitrosococcus halophilus Nc 4]
MEKELSEYRIVRILAEEVCQRIARKTIRDLQRMASSDGLLSGEDSGLNNTWEEICVQLQDEESLYWNTYEFTIHELVSAYVTELPEYERDAVWLITQAGEERDCELEEERDPDPVWNGDIVTHIVDCVITLGNDWSNRRIRAFLNRRYAAI